MLIRLRRTALSKTPHALADGLMLGFQHPVKPAPIAVMDEKLRSSELLFDETFQAHFLSKGFSQFFGKGCHLRFARSFHHQMAIV